MTSLSAPALSVLDRYLHFRFGSAVCSVPYFNNKKVRARGALRALIGKGSPEDIADELQTLIVKDHLDPNALADEALKKILTDNDLGIDCSAFAFYILAAEAEARGQGKLERRLHFVNCTGLVGKMRCSLRPVENCDVATLAHDKNSRAISLDDARSGDFISMLNDGEESERDHILVIHRVDCEDSRPTQIHYSHAVAYPEDGIYGTGIRQGIIEVNQSTSLTDALWTENGSATNAERLFDRAKKSKTELRRLTCL